MPSFNIKHTPKRYTLPKKRLRKRVDAQSSQTAFNKDQTSPARGFFKDFKTQHFLKTINSTLIVIIIVACAVFFVYAPFFGISKIQFKDNKSHTYDDVIKQVLLENLSGYHAGVIPKNHIAIFDPTLSQNAFADHPYIADLHIEKHLLNTLDVYYTLREPAFIFETAEGFFTVDQEGYALALLENSDEYSGMPLIHSSEFITLATQVPETKYLNTIAKVYETITKQFGIGIASSTLIPESFELRVTTNESWDLLLALDKELDPQLHTLLSILTSELADKETRSTLEYIDVRIEQWVYYK